MCSFWSWLFRACLQDPALGGQTAHPAGLLLGLPVVGLFLGARSSQRPWPGPEGPAHHTSLTQAGAPQDPTLSHPLHGEAGPSWLFLVCFFATGPPYAAHQTSPLPWPPRVQGPQVRAATQAVLPRCSALEGRASSPGAVPGFKLACRIPDSGGKGSFPEEGLREPAGAHLGAAGLRASSAWV